MKTLLLILGCFIGLSASSQMIAKGLTAANGTFIGFFEYKPADYTTDPNKKYPLIVFLHGTGEKGNGTTELPLIKAAGIPLNISKGNKMTFTWNGKTETFLVLMPQLSTAYGAWPSFYPDEMIKYAKANLNIDTNRIFLTGLSLGGGGTWRYAAENINYSKTLAAIGVSCGTMQSVDWCNIAKANLPTWAFHAVNDPRVPVNTTYSIINSINACNPAVKPYMTIWQVGGHTIWDQVYDTAYKWQNPNLYEWFLGQNKSLPVNIRPIANAGDDITISSLNGNVTLSGAKSTDADGTMVRFIWRKVAGPAAGVIVAPVSTDGQTAITGLTVAGLYKFELKAVDDRADYTLDTVSVTVTSGAAPNIPPVAVATAEPEFASRAFLKGASTYDPDGTVASYKWSYVDGPGQFNFTNQSAANQEVYNLATGTYHFQLEATDNLGAISRDTVELFQSNLILPTWMKSFNAKAEGNINKLTWTTENESFADHFEPEKSVNGKTFVAMGKIMSSAELSHTYSFADETPAPPITYYRLKLVGKKGEFVYSGIISVDRTSHASVVSSYPSPAHSSVVLQVDGADNGRLTIKLYNTLGKAIMQLNNSKDKNSYTTNLDIQHLPAGIYFAEIRLEEKLVGVQKIVKQ
jgi:predicted esterase